MFVPVRFKTLRSLSGYTGKDHKHNLVVINKF